MAAKLHYLTITRSSSNFSTFIEKVELLNQGRCEDKTSKGLWNLSHCLHNLFDMDMGHRRYMLTMGHASLIHILLLYPCISLLIYSLIWQMKYFGGHPGIEDSAPWGPKFTSFLFVIQGTSVPNFKLVAQIVSEVWQMKYFGGHLGIEDSAP